MQRYTVNVHRLLLTSNRNFGLMLAGTFVSLSAYAYYQNLDTNTIHFLLITSLVVCLIAIAAPVLLTPFNKTWQRLGDLMGTVVSPLVLGVIFFVLLTPTALIGRLFGRDELRLKKANSRSFWIDRLPTSPTAESLKNQF